MLFFMESFRKKFLCGNLLALRILFTLTIFVVLTRLYMDLNRLLVLGMLD
jgi:hypothetical protein